MPHNYQPWPCQLDQGWQGFGEGHHGAGYWREPDGAAKPKTLPARAENSQKSVKRRSCDGTFDGKALRPALGADAVLSADGNPIVAAEPRQ